MLTKRYVEFTALIEAAESIEASPIQIIEDLCRCRALPFFFLDQLIKTTPMSIEAFLIISHLDGYLETTLQLSIKVYQVRIDIIQEGTVGSQTYGDRKSTAERLDISSGRVAFPKLHQVRH